jgi:hypothetical protein
MIDYVGKKVPPDLMAVPNMLDLQNMDLAYP